MSSYEQLIGQALLGTDQDRETSERRLGVKMAVSRAMFCQVPSCGKVLDQSTAALIEFWSTDIAEVYRHGEPDMGMIVVCPSCTPEIKKIKLPPGHETDAKIDTWNGREWQRLETK